MCHSRCEVSDLRVLRTLCDAARGRRLATTPGGAGRVPAGVRGARSLPPDASAEQGNRPTPCVRARLPTWWFDFLEDEGGGRPSHEVRKTQICFAACEHPRPLSAPGVRGETFPAFSKGGVRPGASGSASFAMRKGLFLMRAKLKLCGARS
jgi:hypothetical protein